MFNQKDTMIRGYLAHHIDDNGKYSNLDDTFILAYGPYIAYNNDYSSKWGRLGCDNKLMKFIITASCILKGGQNNSIDKRAYLKQVMNTIQETYGANPVGLDLTERNMLIALCEGRLTTKVAESVMTSISPIVPYTQSIIKEPKQVEGFFTDILEEDNEEATESVDTKIYNKRLGLINGITEILVYSEDINITTKEECVSSKMDKFLFNSVIPYNTRLYYLNALFTYFNIERDLIVKYSTALMNIVSSHTDINLPICAMEGLNTYDINSPEFWNIPDTDTIDLLLTNVPAISKNTVNGKIIDDTFNIYDLDAFIFNNRFMQFDTNAHRFFTNIIESSKITNFIDQGNERIYYEMSNGMIVAPFTDLRDYKVKVVILDVTTGDVYIQENFEDIF